MESAEEGPSETIHTVLLVGFMGCGKTTVGRRVAELLEWDFWDFDDRIEAQAGRPVEEIFRTEGEAAFRAMEARIGREALAGRERVLAPGGGWAARPGRLEGLDPGVLTVWLRVTPATSVERARKAGARTRPLLETPAPVERATELLEERTAFYRAARLHIDSEAHVPDALARRIVRRVRRGDASRTDDDQGI